jgi:single-strand DNA-binding protein
MANFNINKTVLGGRLTADVELKATPNGVSVCQFTIATTRKGDKEKTDFINCVAWRNTAEFISKYFSKGSSICVTGSIQTRSWTDNNGNKRFATELVADEAYFVDSKSENAQSGNQMTAPKYEELSTDEDLPF